MILEAGRWTTEVKAVKEVLSKPWMKSSYMYVWHAKINQLKVFSYEKYNKFCKAY